MENIADALKISFAVFVFIFAVAIFYSVIGKTIKTSNSVLYYTDKTNFYAHTESSETNRTVDEKEIITTLYRIADGETITVTIIDDSGREIGTVSGSHSREDITVFIYSIYSQITGPTVTFSEEFVETNYSGKYVVAEDGSKLPIEKGGTRMYIVYTKN